MVCEAIGDAGDKSFQSPDEDSFAPKSTYERRALTASRFEFQSPDEDSFAPKRQVHDATSRLERAGFSPLTRIRSPQSPRSPMGYSDDRMSFSPLTRIRSPQRRQHGHRQNGPMPGFSPLTRIRSPQSMDGQRHSSRYEVSFSPLTRIRSPQSRIELASTAATAIAVSVP